MEIFIKIVQVLLSLSILILIHELGHFLFARLFKIRVEKFYLFFDIKFTLFKYKPKNGDTEYGIGWLPLGGYCKIAGMFDESMDKEQLAQAPQPWEFRTKPAWQRLLVMLGGVMFNVILAFFIYSMVMFVWGEDYLENKNATYGITCAPLAKEIGFQDGDKIIAFDNAPVGDVGFHELHANMIRDGIKIVTVNRGGQNVDISISEDYLPRMLNTPRLFSPIFPFQIDDIPNDSPNKNSKLAVGDMVVGLDTVQSNACQILRTALANYKGQTINVIVQRASGIDTVSAVVNEQGQLGVIIVPADKFLTFTTKKYSFFASIPAGANKAASTLKSYLKELKLIFSPKTEAYKSVGSFISIGNIYPGQWHWHTFWSITAWLSIMLAVLNLLPIPMLDGGHVVFLLYEMITRRKPNEKFVEYASMAGLLLLLGIMVLAFGNDIFRHILK